MNVVLKVGLVLVVVVASCFGADPVSKSVILSKYHEVKDLKAREAVEDVLGANLNAPLVQKDGSYKCW